MRAALRGEGADAERPRRDVQSCERPRYRRKRMFIFLLADVGFQPGIPSR